HDLNLTANGAWKENSAWSLPWVDSTTQAGTYASITSTVAGGSTLTIGASESVTTDAVVLTGTSTSDLTISGGSLNLIGPGILKVDSVDKKLTINSTLSGTASIDGAGTVVFGQNQTLGGLNGAGKLDIGSTTLTIDGTEASFFAGSLIGTTSSSLVKKGTGSQTISNASAFEGALTIEGGSINALASTFSNSQTIININGGNLAFNGTGKITVSLSNLNVATGNTGTIGRTTNGDVDWNTKLNGGGTLKLTNGGNVTLQNGFANSNGTLFIDNGVGKTVTLQSMAWANNTKLSIGEGQIVDVAGQNITGEGTLSLGKNTTVKFFRGIIQATFSLNASGGDVTFQGFQNGNDNKLNGKMTGTANNVIFNHEAWANLVTHVNWQGSDYIGKTIFKTTGANAVNDVRKHLYTVDSSVANNATITPWGAMTNAVQIGSADSTSSLNITFDGLATDKTAVLKNSIEFVTGTNSNRNAVLELTTGNYQLDGKITATRGVANTTNKSIIKVGAGNLTLTGGLAGNGALDIQMATGKTAKLSGDSAGFTGQLNIASGTLSLGTSLTQGALSVSSGATLTTVGAQTVKDLTVLSGGNLSLSGATLTTTNLTLDRGSSLVFDFGSGTTTLGKLVSTNLSTTGATGKISLDASILKQTKQEGSFTLISGNSSLTTDDFTLTGITLGTVGRMTTTFTKTGNDFILSITGKTLDLSWANGSGIWQAGDSTNTHWNDNNHFEELDSVKFSDVRSQTNTLITLVGNVTPSSIVVDNAETAYTFEGAGSIVGDTSLQKTGTGLLTISNGNTFRGATTITNGTLFAKNANALGTGVINVETSGVLKLDNVGATMTNHLSGAGNVEVALTTPTTDPAVVWGLHNQSDYTGTLKLSSGKLNFATKPYTGKLDIAQGAIAEFDMTKGFASSVTGTGTFAVTRCNADTSNSLNISDFTGILQLNTSGMRFILSSANKNNASTMTIEIGTGAQFWDQSSAGTELKYNFHITGDSTQGTRDDIGGVRFNHDDITLSGDILIDQGAKAMFGRSDNGGMISITGQISGGGDFVAGCNFWADDVTSNYILSGNNTHNATILGIGAHKAEVTAQNDNALGKAAQFVANGSKIIVDTANLNLSSLTDTTTSTAALASEIDLKANTLTVNNTDSSAFKGKITGTGGLVKSGTGSLVVGNTVEAQKSTYSGSTIVNGGTLQANAGAINAFGVGKLILNGGTLDANSTTLGNTALTVHGTSTLKGLVVGDKNKALQDIIVSLGNANEVLTLDSTTGVNLVADASAPLLQQGQTISLVSGSAATLANGTLNLAFANAGAFTLNGSSSLTLSGTLTLNLVDWSMEQGQTYTINLLTNSLVDNNQLITAGLKSLILQMNGQTFTYSDVKNTLSTNGQISFVCGDAPSPSIPEPSTVSLTLLALTGLLLRRRRAN
ncbi:MAG: autotransporter-associated beta strand repeat-containing protein, partial [Akkermansia sp.]